ncbi:exosporium glycoBclA3 domain protein [Clostridioides difficile CD170]|nr:exosporium glycoBclA3 domain protein [Clostridioides difficile CD170]
MSRNKYFGPFDDNDYNNGYDKLMIVTMVVMIIIAVIAIIAVHHHV